MLYGKKIILGVTGGIAAYKAVEILRRLTSSGADVYVVMTDNAVNFINPLTFQVLSGHRVSRDMFDPDRELEIEHISLSREADLILVAPATANFLGKMAGGLADDLLSTICLAARCPIVTAPSMNDRMFTNAAVQSNIKTLIRRGIRVIDPESGPLACEAVGQGRLPAVETILEEVDRALGIVEDLRGRKVVITAGPTRESIDPVRFISNRSSGRMGVALAGRAVLRGAEVVLVLGPGIVDAPPGVTCIRVESAGEMARAALAAAASADIFIASAAVADFTPASPRRTKIKKKDGGPHLELKQTVDILATLGRKRKKPFLVGFAAETGNPVAEGRKKLKQKKADLIVANDVSRSDSGFDSDYIQAYLIHSGAEEELQLLSKYDAAEHILDRVVYLMNRDDRI